MSVDGEGIIGVAGSRDKAESVATATGDGDDGQWGNWTSDITTLAIDKGRIGGGNKPSGRGRDVVPVRECDNRVLVVDVVAEVGE